MNSDWFDSCAVAVDKVEREQGSIKLSNVKWGAADRSRSRLTLAAMVLELENGQNQQRSANETTNSSISSEIDHVYDFFCCIFPSTFCGFVSF